MATANKPKRVGDYNPDEETGETLDKIEGEDVEIAGVSYTDRRGRSGNYTLSIITLSDGRIFHTGSPVIAERLARITEFPVVAKFSLVKSQSNPTQSYWNVE